MRSDGACLVGPEQPGGDRGITPETLGRALALGYLDLEDLLSYRGRIRVGTPEDDASMRACVECGCYEPFAELSEEACLQEHGIPCRYEDRSSDTTTPRNTAGPGRGPRARTGPRQPPPR